MPTLIERVATATTGRDRVLDAAKAVALLLVVLGHSLAWHVLPDGEPVSVLGEVPGLIVLTWLFQVLPLFFAAGAVANAASWQRHGTGPYLAHRSRRLLTPVVVYASFWTVALLPLSAVSDEAAAVGKFLAQLLWFAGAYLLVSALVPVTARWRNRPALTLTLWLALVVAIDVLRVRGAPEAVAWLNFLLVWGLLHQVGYWLPQLRRASRPLLLAGAAAAVGLAVTIAAIGPYAMSLVTVSSDEGLSNLSPPSVVLACYGIGQILLLAAAYPALSRWLSRPRVWAPVALFGSRGFEVYLWHIPLVGIVAGVAILLSWSVPPLSAWWWVVHLSVAVVIVPLAWLLAGPMGSLARRLDHLPRRFAMPAALVAVFGAALVLHISVTGFGAWWGTGMLGLPGAAALNLVVLLLLWQGLGAKAGEGGPAGGGAAAGAARR